MDDGRTDPITITIQPDEIHRVWNKHEPSPVSIADLLPLDDVHDTAVSLGSRDQPHVYYSNQKSHRLVATAINLDTTNQHVVVETGQRYESVLFLIWAIPPHYDPFL